MSFSFSKRQSSILGLAVPRGSAICFAAGMSRDGCARRTECRRVASSFEALNECLILPDQKVSSLWIGG
jgi:hypothetical protein